MIFLLGPFLFWSDLLRASFGALREMGLDNDRPKEETLT